MGASVGIGALIVGTSLMLVFALVVQSLDNRMETSLEIIDDAGEPIPSFQIDDATLWEGAVLTVAITTNGSGYQDGTLVEQSGSGGFSGTFTVDAAGGIETVTITNRGNYSSPPTIIVDISGQPLTSTGATFSSDIGNFIYSNLTNTGPVTIKNREAWLFLDGGTSEEPTNLGSVTSGITTHWYPGETIQIEWAEDGATSYERISLTSMGLTMVNTLA
jgi:archaellum component FlaF (FlaF/FlaG flagellin family)